MNFSLKEKYFLLSNYTKCRNKNVTKIIRAQELNTKCLLGYILLEKVKDNP